MQLTEDILEELLFFTETAWEEVLTKSVLSDKTIVLLLRRSSEVLSSNTDDVISQMIYGNSREPPGTDYCPYQRLQVGDEDSKLPGVWTPPNSLTKGTALKLLFPNICSPFKLPEVPVIPPHIAVGYDAFKYRDVMELAAQHPGQMMKYGFFTSDIPSDAKLLVKTVPKFETRTEQATYEEKIVIQLSKADLDCVLAFSELGPTYMSPNAVDGAKECVMFFPPGYDEPEEVASTKKKSKKKGKIKTVTAASTLESAAPQEPKDKETSSDVVTIASESELVEDEENALDGEEIESGEIEGEDDGVDEADKATSPIEAMGGAVDKENA